MKPFLILSEDIQDYIQTHLNEDVSKLAFKKISFPGVETEDILIQIESKQKCKDKLPTWYTTNNIIFPKKLSIEQTSSEPCAQYKASLVQGNSLIDLTGGFGIDCYYFSKRIREVVHCEMQEDLSQIVVLNSKTLGCTNIEHYAGDSIAYLENTERKWDYIYIDPHRRNDLKQKVFLLSDCLPNVPKHLKLLFSKSDIIILKTSPLLDIQAGLSELSNVESIHIIALNNEVKEVLWILNKNKKEQQPIELISINLNKQEKQLFKTTLTEIGEARYGLPTTYLYEPNAAILKSGKFDVVSNQFNLIKLHKHSHLYTNDNLLTEFPGRSFIIKEIIPYTKQLLKTKLQNIKANITTRNFPLKVEEIRKKWKIKDGGELYIFFTTNSNDEKIVILCSKI